MTWVPLWTDALLYLLLAALAALVLYARRQEHLRRPWRRVVRSRVAMVSLVILAAFSTVGLLDSLHFRAPDSGEVLSLFDRLATPLRTHMEKTYSAPFATHLYSREWFVVEGRRIWTYPRLRYGGAHLRDPAEKWPDIARTTAIGALKGLAVWCLAFLTVALARRGRPPRDFPWKTVAATVAGLSICAFAVAGLSLKYHVLGTDKVGEDVLYQSLKSIRTGLVLGTLTTLVMLPFAIALGVLAGYFRGWVDDVIQYLYTTLNSIPGVLLIAAAILMLQVYMATHAESFTSVAVRADLRLFFLCLILGVTSWTGLCRLLRAETLKLREMEYVQAARALGVSHGRILVRHIVPNLFHIVLISVVLDFSSLVLAEAVLAYVNIGVDPTTYSWGNMINSARLELAREPVVWWTLAAAFLFMFSFVLAANLFADVVRDAFDPRRAEENG
ncbi:peptide/nickel transport system permease protein [Methylomarinovum caldicuralii]|uniref:Peptide/nickel transport system permease protein n=1 Tax=Methylomarinovum caldicuralii TaxID=438856 RepID=A0AAU9CM06_9GAMM|nr:ABC transporter permease [Methylomarinovum caldicuralii]BCX80888.1 peptide/nickel transport system permease protein [Methylomarinovum caldicuralii]